MRNLLSTSTVLAAAIVPIIVACGGREVSLGSNHSSLTGVDPGAISGNVVACGAGAAHPNACCQAGPNTPSKCGVYENDPFHPCDDGWKTYPDPRTCCDLNNPSSCSAPPSSTPPSGGGSCGYACPPGWYPISGGCCQTSDNGRDGVCYTNGGTNGGGGGGNPPDAGFDDGGPISIDGGCAPIDASGMDGGTGCNEPPVPPPSFDAGGGPPPPPPPPPVCNAACPPGWQSASNAPDVCCRETAPNEFECFSQSTGPDPGPPTSTDAGPPGIDDGGSSTPGRACGGSNNGDCSCQETTNGHTYDVSCSDSSSSCTCTIDGNPSGSIANVKACMGPQQIGDVWTNGCHFPP